MGFSLIFDFLGSEAWGADMRREPLILFCGPTVKSIEAWDWEAWEAGNAKVPCDSFRIPFDTFRWSYYIIYVRRPGRLDYITATSAESLLIATLKKLGLGGLEGWFVGVSW